MPSKEQNRQYSLYKGKTVVVTGGAGSIGSAIVRKLMETDVGTVRVLDNNETALFDLEEELKPETRIRTLVGDIREKERLYLAFENADIVFHAAALKHVPLCEYNPFEAVKTNVIGTQNVLDAALHKDVGKVIFISTDKTVNPTNVMGTTKLLAEKLVIAANLYKGDSKTVFSAVRFGNVLDSRGSVIPLFTKQIRHMGPVTITDPDMTRFVMSIPEAVSLVLKAGVISRGREVFILKMPTMRIGDLVEAMIDALSKKYNYRAADIKRKVIGLRPGEKMHEELINKYESHILMENEEMFLKLDSGTTEGEKEYYRKYGFESTETATFSSDNPEHRLSREDIKGIIEGINGES